MIENKIAADARIEHTAATPAIHVDKYTNNSRGFHQSSGDKKQRYKKV